MDPPPNYNPERDCQYRDNGKADEGLLYALQTEYAKPSAPAGEKRWVHTFKSWIVPTSLIVPWPFKVAFLRPRLV